MDQPAPALSVVLDSRSSSGLPYGVSPKWSNLGKPRILAGAVTSALLIALAAGDAAGAEKEGDAGKATQAAVKAQEDDAATWSRQRDRMMRILDQAYAEPASWDRVPAGDPFELALAELAREEKITAEELRREMDAYVQRVEAAKVRAGAPVSPEDEYYVHRRKREHAAALTLAAGQADRLLASKDPKDRLRGLRFRFGEAAALQSMARLETALDRYQQVLKLLGPDSGDGPEWELWCKANQAAASICLALGHYQDARARSLATLAVYEKHLPQDHPDLIRTRTNLSLAYSRPGRYPEADRQCRAALEASRQHWGEPHAKVALALASLAQLDLMVGRRPIAADRSKQALEMQEAIYGKEHPALAIHLYLMAVVMVRLERHAEAEVLHKRACTIVSAAYGADDASLAVTLRGLAKFYIARGRHAEAEPLLRQAQGIDTAAYGPSHPAVARDRALLAAVHKAKRDWKSAEEELVAALAVDEAFLGREHVLRAEDLVELSGIHQETGRAEPAIACMQQALPIYEKCYGPDHVRVALCLGQLSQIYMRYRRFPDAEPLLERELAIVTGGNVPDAELRTVHCLTRQGELFLLTSRPDKAHAAAQRAVVLQEELAGPDDPDLVDLLQVLQLACQQLARFDEAAQLLGRMLKILRVASGEDSAEYATGLAWLAEHHQHRKQFKEAEAAARQSLVILFKLEQETGKPHPDTKLRASSYVVLLPELGLSVEEQRQKLLSLGPEAGWDANEWEERIMGLLGEFAKPGDKARRR